MTRNYETVVVFDHNLAEAALQAEIKKVQALFAQNGAKNVSLDTWGRKDVPYLNGRPANGYFVAYNFEAAESDTVHNIEGLLRITDNLLKFQTHRTNLRVRKVKVNPKAKTTPDSFDDFGDFGDGDY